MTDFRCVFRFTLFIICLLLQLQLLLQQRRRRRRYARFIFILYFVFFFLFRQWFLYKFSFRRQLTNYHAARTPADRSRSTVSYRGIYRTQHNNIYICITERCVVASSLRTVIRSAGDALSECDGLSRSIPDVDSK